MSAGTMYIAKYLECICGESVKCVQLYCERLDLIRIVHKRNLDFFNGLFRTSNCVIRVFWLAS